MKQKMKQIFSCLLALLMLLPLMPAAAFAEGESAEEEQREEAALFSSEDGRISGSIRWEHIYEAPNYPETVSEIREEQEEAPEEPLLASFPTPIVSREEAVENYRNARLNHLEEFSVAYSIPWNGKTADEAETTVREEFDKLRSDACAHVPGAPKLGDSIAHNVIDFSRHIEYEQTESGDLSVYFHLAGTRYFTTLEQEAELDGKVDELLALFDLSGKDDYQKVSTIYDWMVNNILYAKKNAAGGYDNLYYSAYSAAVKGEAVCEGIALLFYRLAMTVGIDTRYVTGGNHAWNIVKFADRYFYLDATWDLDYPNNWRYFLHGSGSWGSHAATKEYSDTAFAASYPLSKKDFSSSTFTGSCGMAASYSFDVSKGTLSISGSGRMTDLSSATFAPWSAYRSLIKRVEVGRGITRIGNCSFASCAGLEYVRIPVTVTQIGRSAVGSTEKISYDGCSALYAMISIDEDNPAFGAQTVVSYGNEHLYTEIIKPANCTENGSAVYTCVCGYSYEEDIPALGHRFSGNQCTRCGYVRENGGETLNLMDSIVAALTAILELLNPLNLINAILNIFGGVTV